MKTAITDLTQEQARAHDAAVKAGWNGSSLMNMVAEIRERGYTLAREEAAYSGTARLTAHNFLASVLGTAPHYQRAGHGWFHFMIGSDR